MTALRGRAGCLALVLGLGWAAGVAAQAHDASDESDDASAWELPWMTGEGDPIGLDRRYRDLARAREPVQPERPAAARPSPPPVRRGRVLSAFASTREAEHRVHARLRAGLAEVQVQMRFRAASDKPQEIRYRLAVPEDAALAGLGACNRAGCRQGVAHEHPGAYDEAVRAPGPAETLPLARARITHDARGAAVIVHAAPVRKGDDLRVQLRYVARAPLFGGEIALELPPRGMDPRAAPATVTLQADGLVQPRIGGVAAGDGQAVQVDPWAATRLRARLADGAGTRADIWHVRCGGTRCARVRVAAGPRAAEPVDLVLAIDVSPSTHGPARGRTAAAVAALLSSAPAGTRVRALAFAARARVLVEQPRPVDEIRLSSLIEAAMGSQLGSATRFESVWSVARAWTQPGQRRHRPLLVIVGDGGMTRPDGKPFARAARAGLEVSALNLADQPARPALRAGIERTSGVVVQAGDAAAAAIRGGGGALGRRVAALFASRVLPAVHISTGRERIGLGALRAGEELLWQGPLGAGRARVRLAGRSARSTAAPRSLRRALATRTMPRPHSAPQTRQALVALDPDDLSSPPDTACAGDSPPAWRPSGARGEGPPLVLAEARTCPADGRDNPDKPGANEPTTRDEGPAHGTGMPASPLLSMLRQRIIPRARGCFRRDRAGRADYSVRAVYVFRLAEREVVSGRVEGSIRPALRACLRDAMDVLEVPPFSGTVIVRYPLYTEREPPPERIELSQRAAERVDEALRTHSVE